MKVLLAVVQSALIVIAPFVIILAGSFAREAIEERVRRKHGTDAMLAFSQRIDKAIDWSIIALYAAIAAVMVWSLMSALGLI